MSAGVPTEDRPIDRLRRRLLEDWRGKYRPTEVLVERHLTADGEDEAWYIRPLVDEARDVEWDAEALSDLDVAVRDKALELGLEYPWFVLTTTIDADEPNEDDEDLLNGPDG